MKTRIVATILAACLAAPGIMAENSHLFIYRNDGGFNHIQLGNSDRAVHRIADDSAILNVGDTDVPLDVIDSCVVRATDIPVLRFTLNDYPDASSLWDKELYLDATLDIDGNGTTESAAGLSLSVKGRGNTTWLMPKKPMRLKFAKKTSICGFAKTKSYVLLNNYLDPTLMKNALSMWLARRLGVPYANHTMPCHVYINNHYQGAYLLTEKVGINSGSVDIDETTGMLFELSLEYDEKYKFKSDCYGLPVMVKDPDLDELYEEMPEGPTPAERLEEWRADFNNAERKASQGKGAEAFDVESVVNYMLLYDIVLNNETGHPKSFYIHKKAIGENEPYYFGPAWDFDVCFNFATPDGDSYTTRSPQKTLWTNSFCSDLLDTPEIKERYAERMVEFIDNIYPDLLSFFDEYATLIEPSVKENGVCWPGDQIFQSWAYVIPSYTTEINIPELRKWIVARVEYLRKKYVGEK